MQPAETLQGISDHFPECNASANSSFHSIKLISISRFTVETWQIQQGFSATPLNRDQNGSSQRTSSTLSISSDDELRRQNSTGRVTWLDPSQDRGSPSSSGTRLSTLSHENSHYEDIRCSTEDSIMSASACVMDASGGRLQATSTRRYSCITNLPPQSSNPGQPGKFLNQFRSRSACLSEVMIEPPKKVNILRFWKWEVLSCVLTLGMLGSMYTILRHYDGGRMPDWGTVINLSTLIALMATILRTMLVYVASEVIGPAKWNYLATGGRPKQTAPVRRLIETSRFNDASQGLLGAFKRLPTTIRDPATLTAVMVMIVSLGTGSFVQEAIQTQPCQFPEGGTHASLPISRNLTVLRDDQTGYFRPTDNPNTLAALSSALSPDSEEVGSPIAFVCSTDNCTFNKRILSTHSTLGVCSACVDTSSLITFTGWERGNLGSPSMNSQVVSITDSLTGNYTLPNGMSVQAGRQEGTPGFFIQAAGLLVSAVVSGLNWAGNLVSSKMMALSQRAFTNITILTSNWLPTNSGYTDYVAATCTLYPCIRSYNASVTSGKLNEVPLDRIPVVPSADVSPETISEEIEQAMQRVTGDKTHFYDADFGTQFQAIRSPCLVNDTIWTKENKSSRINTQRVVLLHADPDSSGGLGVIIENTTAPAEYIYGMDSVARWRLTSHMPNTLFSGNCFVELLAGRASVDCGDSSWLARFYSDERTTVDTIIKQIEAVTDRLSNKMRMGLLNDPESVFGQTLQTTVCSKIQYAWLAFPAVLVAVTNGLLAWTIFQSFRRRGRVMVWKTSILPFLFYSEQFVVQNAEDMSAGSNESSREDDGIREPLLDLDQMEAEARQRRVRFNAFT